MLPRHGVGATLLSAAADEGQGQLSYLPQALMAQGGEECRGGHLSLAHATLWQMSNGTALLCSQLQGWLPYTSTDEVDSIVLPR